jgi:hypothetical protein
MKITVVMMKIMSVGHGTEYEVADVKGGHLLYCHSTNKSDLRHSYCNKETKASFKAFIDDFHLFACLRLISRVTTNVVPCSPKFSHHKLLSITFGRQWS